MMPRSAHSRCELDGEPGSTTCAPTGEYVATVLGGHARTEAVLALPRDALWLPGSLGHGSLRSGAACTLFVWSGTLGVFQGR